MTPSLEKIPTVMTCKRALLGGVFPGVLATTTLAGQAAPSCGAWNTNEYFKAATLEDASLRSPRPCDLLACQLVSRRKDHGQVSIIMSVLFDVS